MRLWFEREVWCHDFTPLPQFSLNNQPRLPFGPSGAMQPSRQPARLNGRMPNRRRNFCSQPHSGERAFPARLDPSTGFLPSSNDTWRPRDHHWLRIKGTRRTGPYGARPSPCGQPNQPHAKRLLPSREVSPPSGMLEFPSTESPVPLRPAPRRLGRANQPCLLIWQTQLLIRTSCARGTDETSVGLAAIAPKWRRIAWALDRGPLACMVSRLGLGLNASSPAGS